MMRHEEISQVVVGQCMEGQIDPGAVNPGTLHGAYASVLEDIRAGMDKTDLLAKHGWEPIHSAELAAQATGEAEGFEWVRHLEQVAARAEAGQKIERLSKKLKEGQEIDVGQLLTIASNLETGELDFRPMSDITPENDPWLPSFYEPIDTHLGGYPRGGLTIIAGPAGLGKTTLLLHLLGTLAKKGKRSAFFSLEMTLGLAAMRLLQVNDKLTDKQKSMILASGESVGIEEVYAKSVRLKSQYPDLYMIGIDYADMMVQKEQSEKVMGQIYTGCAKLAETINTPIVLIGGMSRGYVGGEPMVNHIRYSGMAEHAASVIWLIVNPDKLAVDMGADNDSGLPYVPGMGYLKLGKSRFGSNEGGLGAVQIEWKDDKGRWGDESFGWVPIQVG
jgi:hypothetical protein